MIELTPRLAETVSRPAPGKFSLFMNENFSLAVMDADGAVTVFTVAQGLPVEAGESLQIIYPDIRGGYMDGTTLGAACRFLYVRVGLNQDGFSTIERGKDPTISGFLGAYNGAGTRIGYCGFYNGAGFVGAATDGAIPLIFGVDGDECARFDTTKNFLVGTTSLSGLFNGGSTNPGIGLQNDGSISVQRNNAGNLYLSKAAGASDTGVAYFLNAASVAGSITLSGTTTSYNTLSDLTFKIDKGLLSADDARRIVSLIQIHNYDWKASGEAGVGPFAQELYEICPAAVTVGGWWQHYETGEKRDEEFDGAHYVPWQVDNAKLIPYIVCAAQDQERRLTALEAAMSAPR